jgi:hypothetical protein
LQFCFGLRKNLRNPPFSKALWRFDQMGEPRIGSESASPGDSGTVFSDLMAPRALADLFCAPPRAVVFCAKPSRVSARGRENRHVGNRGRAGPRARHRLGSRSFDGLVAPLLRAGDIGADGAVGLDSLQNQRVVLDFVRNTIAVSDAQSEHDSGYDIVVRARRRSGELIITNATIDHIPVDVVVDTGSNITIGNPALAAALAKRGPRTPTTLYSITGQQIAASIGVSRALVLGKLTIGNVPIAYADAPPFEYLGLARRPAILLGMSELRAFRRVAIDFNKRKVLFDLPPQPAGIVTRSAGDLPPAN